MVECYACKTEVTNGSLIETRILCQRCSNYKSKCSNCSKDWYFPHLEKCTDCKHVFDHIVCTVCKKPSLLGIAYKPEQFKCNECYGESQFNKIKTPRLCPRCKKETVFRSGSGKALSEECYAKDCDYYDNDIYNDW